MPSSSGALAWKRPPTPAELEALLTRLPCDTEYGDGGSRWRVEGLQHSLENSWLYRGTSTSRGERVAIKLCRDTGSEMPAGGWASQEYEVLSLLYPYFARLPGLAVPRPLPTLPQHGMLLTEWIDGPTLTALLLDWRITRARTLREIHRAGRWLSALHRYESHGSAPLDAGQMFRELEADADTQRLVAAERVAGQALRLLRETVGLVSRESQPVARLHGDFKADNLIVSNGALVGLDIALQWRGPVVRDIAPFLNHLYLLALHPRGLRLLPMREEITAAFLEGYAEGGQRMPRKLVEWVRLGSALTVWSSRHRLRRRGARAWYASQSFRWLVEAVARPLL